MKGTHGLWIVAMLAFTLTACGDEEGNTPIPTVDAGVDAEEDVAPDVTDEPDVGPDATEDAGEDAGEDVGEDAGPPPIDLTGTWSVVRDDGIDVAVLMIEQDEQFIEGTVQMATNEVYDGLTGIIGSVLIKEVERTVSITWIDEEDDSHLLIETPYGDEMMTEYSSPDGINLDVTVTRQGQ